MKSRNGFVSNSSSTSFIVTKDQEQEARKDGLVLISVAEFKSVIKKIEEIHASFLIESDYLFNKIKALPDDCFITEPFDRDVAYRKGISDMYGAFETDL